ncbi:MAG: 2-dehydropantoate 2-reductase N-terminal domain-containing protein, partial [Nitrospinota bacterium]
MKTQITVLGAGSWGTAVALLLAEKGLDVLLWAHGKTTFHELSSKRVNTPYLPGIPLSPKITPVHSLKEATSGATDVLLSVPSHTIRGVVSEMKSFLT